MGVSKRGDARGASPTTLHLPHEVIGILLVTGSLLILLSLLSFVPTDVPLFSALFDRSPSAPASPSAPTQNVIGKVGATIATVLFWAVGGGAYLLPFLLIMIGVRAFRGSSVTVTVQTTGGSLAALLFLSALLDLDVPGVPTISSGLVSRGMAGGASGHLLAKGLHTYFAGLGSHIIVLSGLLVSLLLTLPVSLMDLARRMPVWWGSLKETLLAMVPEPAPRTEKAKKSKPKPVKINRGTPAEPVLELPLAEPDEMEEQLEQQEVYVATPVPETVKMSAATDPEEDDEEPEPAPRPVSTGYVLPDPRELLSDPPGQTERLTDEMLKAQSEVLTRALLSFGIEGKVTEVHPGPVVTMYEFEPAPGVKVARIVNLADDLALALKATSLRIVAPLPGKSVVGIEVPSPYRETVSLKEVLTSDAFTRSRSKLTLALGKDIFGAPVTADLKAMPHLLVAGATGAGKSVGLNTMLMSILFSARPDEVKLLLIDPKMLELQTYDGIPHLVRPVITDPKSAARGLGWVVQEMEGRYKLLAEAGVRNIEAYNRRVAEVHGGVSGSAQKGYSEQPELPMEFLSEEDRLSAGETTGPSGDTASTGGKTPPAPLPYIVVMIDELADLMMIAPKEVEDKIARLAQMARAAGIHLVLATQRPSVDVLTGLIKANFPARISFQVSSKTDSRTILDANGAEALVGKGDMLYLASGTGRLMRLHGSFVPDDDVRRVVEFVRAQGAPVLSEERQSLRQEEAAEEQERDEIYEQAKELVISTGQASASLIQRRLRVGYPRAARMIERMEEEGLVSAPARDGRREVVVRKGPVGEGYP